MAGVSQPQKVQIGGSAAPPNNTTPPAIAATNTAKAPPNATDFTQGFVTMADLTALLDKERSRQSLTTFQFIHDPPYPKEILSKPYPKNYGSPTFPLYDKRKGSGVKNVSKFLGAIGAHIGDKDSCLLFLANDILTLDRQIQWNPAKDFYTFSTCFASLSICSSQSPTMSNLPLSRYVFASLNSSNSGTYALGVIYGILTQMKEFLIHLSKGSYFQMPHSRIRCMKAFSIITFLALLHMLSISLNLAKTKEDLSLDMIFLKLTAFFDMLLASSSTSISSLLGMDSFKAIAKYGTPFSGIVFYANFDIKHAIIFITTLVVGLIVTS
ncbi:hypothetical protein SLEP1_g30355 [Rubroshorea leprosula]|uniref:Uncharacterized protein n=1 Tax=Rubroshorea leprosula TaxID=152421 RepID=A0AAV5K896_9ROSI|nr:hypothetical protein SLEP1_g30355 [Rubroshorea leprosula]